MKNRFMIMAAAALLFSLSACGVYTNQDTIPGKWDLAITSVNGITGKPLFQTTYQFEKDKTCTITVFGTNLEFHYTWSIQPKTKKIILTMNGINLEKVYSYIIPDQNTLLLIDSSDNTNRLIRIPQSKGSGSGKMDLKKNQTAFVEEIKGKLNEWNQVIDKMEKKSVKMKGDLKKEFDKEITALKSKRDELNVKILQVQKSADNSWEKFKDDAESARLKFQKSIVDFQNKYQ